MRVWVVIRHSPSSGCDVLGVRQGPEAAMMVADKTVRELPLVEGSRLKWEWSIGHTRAVAKGPDSEFEVQMFEVPSGE